MVVCYILFLETIFRLVFGTTPLAAVSKCVYIFKYHSAFGRQSPRTRVLAALQEVLLLLISAAGAIQVLFSNNGYVADSINYIDGHIY